MSCRYTRRIYRGLCNKLSASVSERWQVQYTTQMASNCTHRGPIGVVNTVLDGSSGFTCTWLTVSGSSKVASCRRELPPIWLVSASYPAWYFSTDRVVEIKYPWTGRFLWQLSCLLQNFLTTLLFTDNRSMSEKYGAVPSTSSESSILDKRYMSSLLFMKRGSSPCIGRGLQTSCILIWSEMHSCSDWVW